MRKGTTTILAGIIVLLAIVLIPHESHAVGCSVFKKGTVRSKYMVANGTVVTAGIKKKGKVMKVVDANTCAFVSKKTFTKSKRKRIHKIAVGNLWSSDGSDESDEIVVTEKLGKRRVKLRIYTVSTANTLELVAKKTVRVSAGQPTLSIANKQLTVDGTAYQFVSWEGSPLLSKVDQSLQFFTIGDEGEVGDGKNNVASAMSTIAQQINGISFIGTLGDNFYPPNTIESTDDEDWTENFITPYNLDGLDVPFNVALGNHDYDDNDVNAILEYHDLSEKWNLPSEYYSFTYPESSITPLIEYWVLDTEMIADEAEGYQEQLDWFASELANSTATWKIVVGHRTLYSYGVHGEESRQQEHILPLLKAGGVDLYLMGHDHDKQLIDRPEDDVTYMVNGAASRLRDVTQGEYSLFAESTLGFTSYTVTKTQLSIDFYNTDAESEFQYIIQK